MSVVVFLDVDGVLNTRTSCVGSPSGRHVGIDESRVKTLRAAMKFIDADGVVLTTTWKNLRKDDEDYLYLRAMLEDHGIEILGETVEHFGHSREDGINDYLDEHPEIEDFVILDDQQFNFDNYSRLWDRFLNTNGMGIEHAKCASSTPSVSAIIFLDGI